MGTELLDRYQEEWNALLRNHWTKGVGGEEPTNPLLLDFPSAYLAAYYRVMIFGQETNDWCGIFPHGGGVNHMLKAYKEFCACRECYSYGGQFWNGVAKLIDALKTQIQAPGRTMAVMWNNLIKIGKANAKGKPSAAMLDWGDRWFDVVSFEVNELKPNLVIFFSGPDYDRFITRVFDDAAFEAINAKPVRQLARVKSHWLPTNSIRTYHPNYLWRHGFYEYVAEIVCAIRS